MSSSLGFQCQIHYNMGMKEWEPSMICPGASVADAMMVAVYRQIAVDLRMIWQGAKMEGDFSDLLQKRTASGCRLGAAHVLYDLAEKHKYEFDISLMIEAVASGPWAWHDYFLVRGIDGVWYAGSPANYGREPIERTTNIVSSLCLESVIQTIENIEGSKWPSEQEILEKISKKGVRVETGESNQRQIIKYYCVAKESDKVIGKWHTMKM